MDQGQRRDPLREGDQCLLVPPEPRVDVDMSLVLLGGEHVGLAGRETVGRRGALLEGSLGAQGRVQLVGVDADISGDLGPRGDRGTAHGREEGFGKHVSTGRNEETPRVESRAVSSSFLSFVTLASRPGAVLGDL